MEELGRYKESTKGSSCQQLTLSGFQVFPLKKKKKDHFYYFTNVPRKVLKIEPSSLHPKTKELFITWWILIHTVCREKEQLRIF